ncbi:MAG: hypothetical protein KAT49_04680 [Methanomicrobia archaeon]|nr:hypothetical protein [Methanomicrobia archaeon]MCK4637155.1 hypothetical protein [Methanomicrobia archaeon]
MSTKNVYLLKKANSYKLESLPGFYDEERQINLIPIDNKKCPLVSLEMSPPTQSKTFAAPGDDDPDPEDERCY